MLRLRCSNIFIRFDSMVTWQLASRAQQHDEEFFALDAEFQALIDARKNPPPKKTPAGVTLH